MRRLILSIALIFPSCLNSDSPPITSTELEKVQPKSPATIPTPSPEPSIDEYPGRTIDQLVPILTERNFSDETLKSKVFEMNAESYQVVIDRFAPRVLRKAGRNLIRFRPRTPDSYHSSLVGISHLLGRKSKQVYVVATGPGAVCCTNYWIVDVSSSTARVIFRSEDFGRFRDPMEVFDEDGDGIYELVQFDSCMRYFRDDCGTCSPEPRAYFKYDLKRRQYRPIRGIAENFVRKWHVSTEKLLQEKLRESRRTHDATTAWELKSLARSHVADLLHLGLEKKAWRIFSRYDGDARDRREILSRLRQCPFYQALRRRYQGHDNS